ncbi:hypothetical protein EDD18DRAFT_1108406 [Armillaria luteobubalina]|uniref:Uncharacterized protein n=1 Tax=Armillaria luteobubalina TaxID=153913 RepID=A0AA39Q046_9AGAR|nr:hypothetical protein EDD18DRAFT_1108406 [Armillaria luteobubalina]
MDWASPIDEPFPPLHESRNYSGIVAMVTDIAGPGQMTWGVPEVQFRAADIFEWNLRSLARSNQDPTAVFGARQQVSVCLRHRAVTVELGVYCIMVDGISQSVIYHSAGYWCLNWICSGNTTPEGYISALNSSVYCVPILTLPALSGG